MENKLNQLALEQYAKKYANLLAKKIFATKNTISGKQIMEEIPVNQVALFTLFNLFKLWKVEMEQLKSPYFNYDDEQVQVKLKELMNVLSKKISVLKEDFIPLLEKSVESTLLLIISPLSYYRDLVNAFKQKAPNMEEVKDLQRFIKINSDMRDALLTAWASNYSGEELFNKAFEGLTEPPQDVTPLLSPFNKLLPFDMSNSWMEKNSKIDLIAEDVEEDVIEETKIEETNVEISSDIIEDDDVFEEADFDTVHTQFKEEKTQILADSLGFDSKSMSIKSMLTINQKFMFINDLFDGSKEDFLKVIDFLDTCETKEVVIKFIQSNYIQRGNWKPEAPQVKDFFDLINRKFS